MYVHFRFRSQKAQVLYFNSYSTDMIKYAASTSLECILPYLEKNLNGFIFGFALKIKL